MGLSYTTWIRDPVHGSVQLTDLERQVVDTAVFQRLRRVKQLGLACLAFPSADYPRFEHSLGVMEVTGRLLNAVNASYNQDEPRLTDVQVQKYRLAALLHDIGHYPFSHAMEDAIKEFYGSPALEGSFTKSLDHEEAGHAVMRSDPELSRLLPEGFPEDICSILQGSSPDWHFHNMVSSDLDADRLDYLARTSCHTGLPYGKADINYLIQGVREDGEGRLCFDEKALRSVEHMLLARFFDFETLVRHRVVAGSEYVLKRSIVELCKSGILDCSAEGIEKRIKERKWAEFDDLQLLSLLHKLGEQNISDLVRAQLRCILHRSPPKCIAEAEWIEPFKDSGPKQISAMEAIEAEIPACAKELDVGKEYLFIWRPRKLMRLTDAKGTDPADEGDHKKSARVLGSSGPQSSPVECMPRSIMNKLAGFVFCSAKLFVIPPAGRTFDKRCRAMVRDSLKQRTPQIQWK